MSRTGVAWRVEWLEPRRLLAAVPVADLETIPASSSPTWITDAGGTVFFAARSPGGEGNELWKTDGTAAGTVLVKDLFPGSGSSNPSIAYVNGKVFVVTLASFRHELWATDGTDAGTVRLTSATLPAESSDYTAATLLAPFDGHLFFWATDPEHGWRLWKSDGTSAGTLPVKAFPVMHGGALTGGRTAEFNGRLYFTADEGQSGSELWATDGTEAGTVRVRDINPGPAGSDTQNLTVSGGLLYFTATDAAHGSELWRTDGTEAGTLLVKDLRPGTASSTPWNLTASGGRLFLTARPSDLAGNELWISDGTDAGTVALARNPGGHYFNLLTDFGGTLFFAQVAPRGSNAFGLWKSDGTAAGTVYLAQANVAQFARVGTTLVFRNGLELWRTDGTYGGTVLLRRFDDAADSYPDLGRLTVSGDAAFFAAYTTGAGRELWRTDGTAQGTKLVRDINAGPVSSNPDALAPAGGGVYFSAIRDDIGVELWKSDGTEAGTVLVEDVFPGTEHSNPFALDDDNGTLYFATTWGLAFGTKVYRTRPGENGVERLDGVPSTNKEFFVDEMVVSNGRLFLGVTTYPQPYGRTLWVSDGTPDGGRAIYSPGGTVYDLTEFDGGVYFGADGYERQSLWKSDGTAAGTVPVADFAPGQGPRHLLKVNGTLLFSAGDPVHGRELWKSDGTPEGTALVADIVSGPSGSGPDGLVNVGGTLFFRAATAAGTELWKSDGTPAGTVRVAAISARPPDVDVLTRPGFEWLRPPAPFGAALNGVLLFANGGADGDADGVELWRSDGTEAGTVKVKDIEPGPGGSDPHGFVEFGGRVYFSAYDRAAGRELWSTDGTANGTQRVQDIYPGPIGSSPTWLTPSGGALWFNAAGREIGRELWRFAPAPPASIVARHVFYNGSSFDGPDPAPGPADDGAIATDKVALLPGQAASFANVISYDKGINGVMVDLANLPAGPALTADDFDFRGAGRPISVTVRPGAGLNGSDRVTLIWREFDRPEPLPLPKAAGNGWLTVTVKANAHTGLAAPDVFSFGNLIGEAGDGTGANGWRVSSLDLAAVKRALNTTSGINATTDFNRDGRTNALDLAIVRRNLNHALALMPQAVAGASAAAGPGASWVRGLLEER